jgi:uncharacterized membrane protein
MRQPLAHISPTLLVGIVLFVVALLLRFYNLGGQSLWLDEGSTWQTIQQGWGILLAELFSPVSAYPLYHVLLKGWAILAGESEWALRFPSAVAGAAAVVALYVTALECGRAKEGEPQWRLEGSSYPLVAAVLMLVSPFAIWYAQEVKVYSLFLLIATLCVWAFLRALRVQTQRAWLLYGGIALTSVFVHRFAILLLIAAYAALLLVQGDEQEDRQTDRQDDNHLNKRVSINRLTGWLLFLVVAIGMVAAMVLGLGSEGASTGAHIPAGPGLALWLTIVRFSLDRGPGEFPWWWLVPFAVLMVWGLAAMVNDLRPSRAAVRALPRRVLLVLLCFLIVPLLLFLAQLVFTRFYETRYLMLIFPVWVLVLAYPLLSAPSAPSVPSAPSAPIPPRRGIRQYAHPLFPLMGVGAAVVVSIAGLFQSQLGLYSGDPVKEEFRAAFRVLAQQVHPDDVIVLHPAYMQPLYNYYMPRFTTDSPPDPALFAAFKQGQTEFTRRDWHAARRETFAGHARSFLVISPDHARTVDIPNAYYGDEYGLVGIYFQFSEQEKKWLCGNWRFQGVHLFCQESPEMYVTGEELLPQTPLPDTWFGEHLQLLGYTLKPTTPAGVGEYRAGGTIPISLFWEVSEQIDEKYSVFLHLCQDCSMPPVASDDGQPLGGYLPTSVWLPRNPARDDRALHVPPDTPPGRYTLLLGLYPPDTPAPEARLPVRGGQVLDNHRLVLGEVEIVW